MGVAGALIQLAVTIASVAYQAQQSSAAADSATHSAENAAAADYAAQYTEQEQVNAAAAQESGERARQAMIERARLRVSAGESGLSGITPQKEQSEVYMQEGLDAATLEVNRANKIRQVQAEKGKTEATRESRINAANSTRQSGWSTALQIGSAMVSSGSDIYDKYYKPKSKER